MSGGVSACADSPMTAGSIPGRSALGGITPRPTRPCMGVTCSQRVGIAMKPIQ